MTRFGRHLPLYLGGRSCCDCFFSGTLSLSLRAHLFMDNVHFQSHGTPPLDFPFFFSLDLAFFYAMVHHPFVGTGTRFIIVLQSS